MHCTLPKGNKCIHPAPTANLWEFMYEPCRVAMMCMNVALASYPPGLYSCIMTTKGIFYESTMWSLKINKTFLLKDFCRKNRLRWLINDVTRPYHGGTAIDNILSNARFISQSGVRGDLISDHLPVFAVKKKERNRTVLNYFKVDHTKIMIKMRWRTYWWMLIGRYFMT